MNKILDSFDRKSPLKWLVVIGLVVIIGFIIHAHIEKPLIDEIIGDDFVKQGDMKVVPVPIPKKLSFAGEEVPLNLFYVRESLDRELTVNTYWHSQSLLLFKRAHRYFPVIEPILKKNDIPEDFKYMILAESGFLHNISIAGAAGYWQFIKSTAQEYGLEVNQYVDERYNLEKSTEAMCKFLKKAYEKYGTWTLAAAAFNGGMGRFDRIVQSQKTTNYYEMYMNQETSRYIFRILAFKL
ncbi:MAG: lytic transglycosylase domain-containing protein, partial [Bacteroidales bacterium]|nr:lytic transglycosylase domain-containing protein [Bacteroidales bacterium]